MAIVNPETSRASIAEFGDYVVITVPAKRNWFLFLFLSFWLCGWAMGEITVLGGLIGGSFASISKPKGISGAAFPAGLFMLVWLGGWTVGGFFAIAIWLYQLKGKEIIKRDAQFLSHQKDFVVYKKSKEYMNEHIKDLRISASGGSLFQMNPERAMELWGVGGGAISFDYGAKTIRIGAGLDEAESKPVIEILSRFGT